MQAVRGAEPNGQTLLVAPDAIVTLFPHVFKEVGYDPFKDLTPISQILHWSYRLRGAGGFAGEDICGIRHSGKGRPEVCVLRVALDRQRPAYSGPAARRPHRQKLDHVPFKGAADAINALLSNSVPSAILTLGELTNFTRAGRFGSWRR